MPVTLPPDLQPLAEAHAGDLLTVVSITEPETAMQAMRLGIAEGETIEVASRVPGGPLVIRRGKLEIALGRELCKSILVHKSN